MRIMLLLLLPLLACKAQVRIAFDQVQLRMESPDWTKAESRKVPDTLYIDGRTIRFNADRAYELTIVGNSRGRGFATNDNNRVYACKDRNGIPVQVFLIAGERVFIYFKTYHIKLTIAKT